MGVAYIDPTRKIFEDKKNEQLERIAKALERIADALEKERDEKKPISNQS